MVNSAWEADTLSKYGRWWARFLEFVGEAPDVSSVSALVEQLLAFAAELVIQRNFSGTKQAIAAVAQVIKTRTSWDLWRDCRLAAFNKGLCKLAAISKPPLPKRDILPVSALTAFISSPPSSLSPFSVALIAAVLSVGIRCIRRPGELADLHEDQLSFTPASGAKLSLRFTKADQAAQRAHEVPFEAGVTVADPIRCLDRYLRIAKGRSLFGWTGRAGERLFTDERGRALTASQIKDFVRLVAAHSRLPGRFGGHSIRISGACLAILGGLSLEQVMAIGGWKGSAFSAYLRGLVAVSLRASTRMGL